MPRKIQPIAEGGTGATSAADARTALDVYAKTEAGRILVANGSTLATPASGTAVLFIDSNNNNQKTIKDSAGALTLVDETITVQTTLANLTAAFAAASYTNKWAEVFGDTAEDGLYKSNGSQWILQLSNPGDRTDLWDYASGIAYNGTNTMVDKTSYSASGTGSPGNMLDGNISTAGTYTSEMYYSPNFTQIVFAAPRAFAKFVLYPHTSAGSEKYSIKKFYIKYSTNGSTWTTLTSSLLSADNGASVNTSTGLITFSGSVAVPNNNPTTILTTNSSAATYWRIEPIESYHTDEGGARGAACIGNEIMGYEFLNNTGTIDCVRSVNKLNARLLDSGTWVDNGSGVSSYAYAANAILKYGGLLYRNKSGASVAAGSNPPSTDTSNWEIYMPTSGKIGSSTDYTEFEADGTMKCVGDATTWEDVNIAGAVLAPGGSAPTKLQMRSSKQYNYSYGVGEDTSGILEMPHSFCLNDAVEPHLHFLTDTVSADGNVKFAIYLTPLTTGGIFPASDAYVFSAETAVTEAWKRYDMYNFSSIPVNILSTLGTHVCMAVERIAASSAEYGGEVFVLTAGLHFEQDTLGSRQPASK